MTNSAVRVVGAWAVATVGAAGLAHAVLADATDRITDPVEVATPDDAWWPPLTAPVAGDEPPTSRADAADPDVAVPPVVAPAASPPTQPVPVATGGTGTVADAATPSDLPATPQDEPPTEPPAETADGPEDGPADGTDGTDGTGDPAIARPDREPVEEMATVADTGDDVWLQDRWLRRWMPWLRADAADPAVDDVPAPHERTLDAATASPTRVAGSADAAGDSASTDRRAAQRADGRDRDDRARQRDRHERARWTARAERERRGGHRRGNDR